MEAETNTKKTRPAGRRSWNQAALDREIEDFKKKHFYEFEGFRRRIQDDDKKAIPEAQKLFGRNAISEDLTAPKAMVSKSEVWQQLAEELGIPHGSRKGRQGASRLKKVGYETVAESRNMAVVKTPEDEVAEKEILDRFREARKAAESKLATAKSKREVGILETEVRGIATLIDKLELGEITVDQAAQQLELIGSQRSDDQASTVPSRP
ncbi:MAG: hypothetical protein ACYTG0_25565 [Planctomycetota bacterium]